MQREEEGEMGDRQQGRLGRRDGERREEERERGGRKEEKII